MKNKENDIEHIIMAMSSNQPSSFHLAPGDHPLGAPERDIIAKMNGEQPLLPYPTQPLKLDDGATIPVYVIPKEDLESVLQKLYLFTPVPNLDDVLLDLHENSAFTVRDFIVTRENGCNVLASPFYPHSGGTFLDWLNPEEITNANAPFEAQIRQFRSGFTPKGL